MEKETDEIIIPEGATFQRKYTYLPYTYHRIVSILKSGNMYLELITWYKAYRNENCYGNRQRRYNIREYGTNRLIRENLYLNDIREILANLNFPLQEPERETRNQEAERFLEIVRDSERIGDVSLK